MLRTALIFFMVMISLCSKAQDKGRLISLTNKIANSATDADKINALTELAEYYSVFNLANKADSVLQEALMIAEDSEDKSVVTELLLNNTIANLNSGSSNESFTKAINLLKRGLSYAQDMHNDRLEALAYIRLADVYLRKNLYDEALQNASKAFTALDNIKNSDSVKTELYLELGDIYFARSDAATAYENYNQAFEIAYRNKDIKTQSKIYHRFSELYQYFSGTESAKNYLLQSLRLNTVHKDLDGLFLDYVSLAKITDQREYIEKALLLADKLDSPKDRMIAKRLMYYWYMVDGKISTQTFHYLYSNPDLVQYFANETYYDLTWQKACIYKYGRQYDSALHYFLIAAPKLIAANSPSINSDLYSTLAETYTQTGNSLKANEYYEKTYSVAGELNQLVLFDTVSKELGRLSAKNSDYKTAYQYSLRADSAAKLLQEGAASDKVALLGIDRLNKQAETDLQEEVNHIARKHNLQILAITLLIISFFGLMLLIGMFEVSKTFIRILGYLGFISLFEFIVVLIDKPIDSLARGAPLNIWLIKICIVALLAPLQHLLETRVIAYLQSRKLLEARQKFSIKKIWQRRKPVAPANVESADEVKISN